MFSTNVNKNSVLYLLLEIKGENLPIQLFTQDFSYHFCDCYSFAHPHVRARLEKHMGSNLVKLTSKPYMTELEDRIHEVHEEQLNKRIAARVVSLLRIF